jgi:hypothetical protein
MRTTPATATEVDAWLTVLRQRGHIHDVQNPCDGTWVVRQHPAESPWTLHHPVLAMDWIEDLIRETTDYQQDSGR